MRLRQPNVIKKKSTKVVNVATFNVIFAVIQCDLVYILTNFVVVALFWCRIYKKSFRLESHFGGVKINSAQYRDSHLVDNSAL